jgi:hypothetical protein
MTLLTDGTPPFVVIASHQNLFPDGIVAGASSLAKVTLCSVKAFEIDFTKGEDLYALP